MKSKNYLYLGIAIVVIVLIAVLAGGKKSAPSQEEQFIAACAGSGGSYNTATKTCVPPKIVVSPSSAPVKPVPSATTITQPVVYTTPATPQPNSYQVHVVRGGAYVYYAPTTTVSSLIQVSNPPTNTIIKSPYTLSGMARGPWYSNGTASVILTNSKGVIISRANVQAQGNTQTNEFVPFMGTLVFPPQPTGSSGVVIFTKSNPSVLPANAASVEILVNF